MISKQLITKINTYRPLLTRLKGLQDTPMLYMVGVSGAGKDTIITKLLHEYPQNYTRFITHTTRVPRFNHGKLEQNGREYYFIDFKQAEQMLDDHSFIETNLYSGNIYGTSIAELKRAHDEHRTLVTDVDVNGVAHLMKTLPQSKPVFILPPSYEVWQRRFLTRYSGDIDQDDYRKRMRTAFSEIKHALSHDYFYLVINDDIEITVQIINDINTGKVQQRQHQLAVDVAQSILQELYKII